MKRVLAALTALLVLAGCRALEVPPKPESTCIDECLQRTNGRCSDLECHRGCRSALDRLVEREGHNIITCVAKATDACNDELWAECAAKIGIHADGGPPAPAKPPEDEE